MNKCPKWYCQPENLRKLFIGLELILLFMFALLVACSPRTETETVEVTRVVTETVKVEGETVEVTRIVTETVVVAPEEDTGVEPPSATGSEGDAGPLPPPPDDGAKVAESRGSTPAADLALETAVTLRADQTNNTSTAQDMIATTSTSMDPTELQKWCQLATELYKKRCG